MGLMASRKKDYPLIDGGVHHAVCYAVIDLGTQHNEFYDKDQHKVVLIWELPDERIDIERDGKMVNLPRAKSRTYTLSLGKKADLYRDLVSWRGVAFTADELKGFDIFNVAGANCMLQIIHEERNGEIYANITAVTSLLKGMEKKVPENPIVKYCMATDGYDIPENIPDWVKDIIKKSREYQAVHNAAGNADLAAAQEEYGGSPPSEEDDIPF